MQENKIVSYYKNKKSVAGRKEVLKKSGKNYRKRLEPRISPPKISPKTLGKPILLNNTPKKNAKTINKSNETKKNGNPKVSLKESMFFPNYTGGLGEEAVNDESLLNFRYQSESIPTSLRRAICIGLI